MPGGAPEQQEDHSLAAVSPRNLHIPGQFRHWDTASRMLCHTFGREPYIHPRGRAALQLSVWPLIISD